MLSVNDINPQMINELIEKVDRLEKMLYDYNAKGIKKGVIKGIKVQQVTETVGTEPEVVLSEIYKNANGGTIKINDINGNLNIRMGSENGTGNNAGGTIVLLKDCPNEASEDLFKRVVLGILTANDEGAIQLLDTTGYPTITIRAGNTSTNAPAQIRMIDSNGITEINTNSMTVGSEEVATQSWVADYVASHQYIPPAPTP